MTQRQRVTVLGSTGSVGANTLDVMARHPQRFEAFALTASTRVDDMFAQCVAFKPSFAVMASEPHGRALRQRVQLAGLSTQVLWGSRAIEEVACHEQCDSVMAAIVGAAGLGACIAAARAGKRLMLANKEALVVGASLFMSAVRDGGAVLLPIDSEHSAVFQSLPDDASTWGDRVDKIILTASGGPFRTRELSTMARVTPAEAVAHPNWVMGQKISVDSATMMNKALEVIEAHYLFGLPVDRIEVVIHPQSVVHSMVQYRDGSVVAQLGTPDMRVPIAYGLAWPDRIACGARTLDFRSLAAMTFEDVDPMRFPGLDLAWQALDAAPGTTAVLNAANEVAVQAFLDGRVRFDQIHEINLATLTSVPSSNPTGLEALLDLDARARQWATGYAERLEV